MQRRMLTTVTSAVRSGRISIDIGKLRSSGFYGFEWSLRAYSEARAAFGLYFNVSGVNSSDGNNRWYGHPLRCLARQQ